MDTRDTSQAAYEMWKSLVDACLRQMLGGLDSEGLPDAPYYRWYELGFSPVRAAKAAIARAKNF